MNAKDVQEILNDIDKALASFKTESKRLASTYEQCKNMLEEIQNRLTLNRVLRNRAGETLAGIENAWRVHLGFTSMLMALLQFSRSSIDSYSYKTLSTDAEMGEKIADFLKQYTLMGYAHTVYVLVTMSVSLRHVFQKGKRAELIPKVKEVLKVTGEVIADEAAKATGADTVQNLVKIINVVKEIDNALNVSMKSMEDVSDWTDHLDEADQALQSWVAKIATLTEGMGIDIEQAIRVRDS